MATYLLALSAYLLSPLYTYASLFYTEKSLILLKFIFGKLEIFWGNANLKQRNFKGNLEIWIGFLKYYYSFLKCLLAKSYKIYNLVF